jgi:hypothetical protein
VAGSTVARRAELQPARRTRNAQMQRLRAGRAIMQLY